MSSGRNFIVLMAMTVGWAGTGEAQISFPFGFGSKGRDEKEEKVIFKESPQFHQLPEELRTWLRNVGKIAPNDFPSESEVQWKRLESFIEDSIKKCLPGALSSPSSSGRPPCLQKMQAVQAGFIDKMMESRIRYLDFLHKKRVDLLINTSSEFKANLDKNFERNWKRLQSKQIQKIQPLTQ